MSMIKLSETQEKVASFVNGALLVKAGAGSGKTRVLTERIKRLLKITKRKVLAITFTNKASEEIKERLQDCEEMNEKLYVGTFHSFCNTVLEKHGNAIGYPQLPQVFSEDSDKLKIIEEVISQIPTFKESYENKDDKGKREFKNKCLEIISKIKRNVILDNELKSEIDDEEIILLYMAYRKELKSLNAIDFDDLLLEAYKLFITYPNIAALYRRNFEYVCVDEAQDLNKAQYMLLKTLIGDVNPNIMLVGDEKQCIYAFIGSDSSYMMQKFVSEYNPTIIELKENFRSSKEVLKYANRIMSGSTEINDTVLEGICEENDFETQEEEAKFVIEKIKELIELKNHQDIEGEISYSKISVLGRTKYVLSSIEDELKKNEIPYYYKNTQRMIEMESISGKAFNLALQIRINPKDSLHLSELLMLLNLSFEIKNLEELINNNNIANTFVGNLIKLVISLKDDGSNFTRTIKDITESIPKSNSIVEDDEKALAYADFIIIKNAWYKYAKSTNNKSLSAFHNSLALGQVSSFDEKNGIELSTVHTMKGQENDIVFLIGMDDLTFPDYRAVRNGGVELQQEKNDLYVAVTRAKRFLYISYPKTRKMPWGTVYYRNRSSLLPQNID